MWSDRNVRAVVLARLISRVGGEAAFFVGIWGKAAFELEATPSQLAAVMAALGVASLIGASVAGVLVDRFDPRRVVIWGELAFVPAALALIFADSIPNLVVATFVLGLVGTPVFTAISSFGPFLTDNAESLARINSWIEAAIQTPIQVRLGCPEGLQPDAKLLERAGGRAMLTTDPAEAVKGADFTDNDDSFPVKSEVAGVQRSAQVETRPYGEEQDRQAYLAAGDVLAVVLQSRKGTAPAVPFRQTVVLQSQLLG